ncbi:hypothetical protein [Caldicoprobacter faecalis]|uniref:Uncharacterized protein n=1 Tax=Caldicoprobacter faecalis TaxID=937334 RepID=A0A1I5WUR2_9FIRM|nr:hypothetical protein [Caldicoprobacter faecalis]SFQ23502.1 hypothetical protein SAMN05444406_11945 [Caldicoprobacter faecalis]
MSKKKVKEEEQIRRELEFQKELAEFKEKLKEENIGKFINEILEENRKIREQNKQLPLRFQQVFMYSFVFKDYVDDTYGLENFSEEEIKQIDKIVEALKKDEENLSEDDW